MLLTAAPATAATDPRAELDRQLAVLLDAGVPALTGRTAADLAAAVAPLADRLPAAAGEGPGGLPFVLVLGRALLPPERAVPLLALGAKAGVTSMDDADVASFVPLPDLDVPDASAHLLLDVDLGAATRDVPPAQALPLLLAQGRSPLTLEEGLAVLLQAPQALRTARFSLLGSRCGDRRVPALWVRGDGHPRLGWCWEGAPHTWLGSASCAGRVA